MVPPPFQTLRALRTLNIAAVACAMASLTSVAFSYLMGPLGHESGPGEVVALVTGATTALVGALWAWVLRSPKTVGPRKLRWGWVLSLPLAILNTALACGLLLAYEAAYNGSQSVLDGFLTGAAVGAFMGVIVWLPALVAVLVCFGMPIAHAQRLAQKGLAGEEYGERIVGSLCAALGLAACALNLQPLPSPTPVEVVGSWFTGLLAVSGVLAGGAAVVLATRRERRRQGLVAGVEAGEVPGYRVDATDEGKVLVRVTLGESYRVADFEEQVFELDENGLAVRATVVG